ncbi:hypothetical protein WR25_05627 isoform A [Diploscapter pachys]|uniref:C2H2-type domain-containing protein n=2 Tax=Diploscapter pachys TaxID=2018661 RepID=A0A2A2JR29_9BILA|nr:hypothetical protein WR25_05627 isoform A [Diploscapter pachys]
MESITCCLCPIERPSSKLLKEHISFDHLDWQPYKCAYCSKTRASKAQLLEHCLAVHQIRDPEMIYESSESKHTQLKKLLMTSMRGKKEELIDVKPANLTAFQTPLRSATALHNSTFSTAAAVSYVNDISSLDATADSLLQQADSNFSNFISPIPAHSRRKIRSWNPRYSPSSSPERKYSKHSEKKVGKMPKTELKMKNSSGRTVQVKKESIDPANNPNFILCNCCRKYVLKENVKQHAYKHIFKEENLAAFSCSYPDCSFRSHNKMGVAVHIGMIHAHEGDYEVKEMLTKDMEDKAVRMMEKCFDQAEVKAQDFAEKFNDQESIIRTIKKKTNSVKTSFCQICQRDYVTRTDFLFLRHLGLHMKNMHGLVRFACSVCEYTTPQYENMQRHAKTMHGKADCFTDEIGTWSPAQIREVSKLCFGSEDLAFSRLPDEWHLKWKTASPEADSTMTTDTNTSTSEVQQNPSEMGTVKMELELEMEMDKENQTEKNAEEKEMEMKNETEEVEHDANDTEKENSAWNEFEKVNATVHDAIE